MRKGRNWLYFDDGTNGSFLDDLLIAGSMGAYTYAESTRFNGFEAPKFVYID